MDLDALIKRTEAKLAAETNPKRRAEIALDLATYAKTRAECDDEDPDEDDAEKKASAAKKAEEKKEEEEKKASARAKKAEEEKRPSKKSEEKKEEDDDEDEAAKAALALIESQTGMKGSAAIGAAAGTFARLGRVEQQTAQLAAAAAETEKSSLLEKVKAYIPATQHAWLATQKIGTVRSFVAEATKGAPMVHTADGDLLIPRESTPGTEAALPKDIREMLDQTCAAIPAKDREAYRKAAVEALLKDHNKALNGASAGAMGRH